MLIFNSRDFDPNVESSKIRKVTKRFSNLLDELNVSATKNAAVLIAVFQYDGKPHVILTERSKSLRTHRGQVALPGGKVDDTDRSVEDAAIREAREEIGLLPEHVRILGTTFPVYSSVAKLNVYPVVGYIKNIIDVKLEINTDEVASIFAVPLQAFCENSQYSTYGKYRFPKLEWNCGEYQILDSDVVKSETMKQLFCSNRKYVIWGITAIILDIYAAISFNHIPKVSALNSPANVRPIESNTAPLLGKL